MHIPFAVLSTQSFRLPRIFQEVDPIARLPHLTTATIAGIIVAISGNVLISLALNCQKLAHKRLERERQAEWEAVRTGDGGGDNEGLAPSDWDHLRPQVNAGNGADVPSGPISAAALVETEPLLNPSNGTSYGTSVAVGRIDKPGISSRLSRFRRSDKHIIHDADQSHLATTHALLPVDVVPIPSSPPRNGHGKSNDAEDDRSPSNSGNESDYLRSRLWWFGFLLMNVGEMGNFISYAFAPASAVAPLGTFALIANCLFAPLMLQERFRSRDFFGIAVAIIGALTVVLSINPSDVRLDPRGLIEAISQRLFVIYSAVYIAGIIILSGLSEGNIGGRHVFVDVGLCALFGGFTVLSTKAISTLLTLEWFEMFTEWITYPVIAVLLVTGVGQIRYLNRALMRFDSKIVVPTQFVMFNLSAIVGSAILYGDFRKTTFHQLVTFLYGCGATFAGVFIIAWAPAPMEGAEPGPANESEGLLQNGDDAALGNGRAGSVARRSRVRLLSEPGTPILRNKPSYVSLYGLSPAQRVLIINTPPRDEFVRPHSQDVERELLSTPDSTSRRRAISWVGEDAHGHHGQDMPKSRDHSCIRWHESPADRSLSSSPS